MNKITVQLCVKCCGTVTVDKDIIIKREGNCPLDLHVICLRPVSCLDCSLTECPAKWQTVQHCNCPKCVEVCTVSLWWCGFEYQTAFRWPTALIQLFRSHKQLSAWMWMSIQQQTKDSKLLSSDESRAYINCPVSFLQWNLTSCNLTI